MNSSSKVIIIPARLESTRFPGKALAPILGKPMIQHVYDQCAQSKADRIIVATDHHKIYDACRKFGAEVQMTSPNHFSGTDRCIEVAEKLPEADYLINVQGDEPLIDPQAINELFENIVQPGSDICTLIRRCEDYDAMRDPNVVKCVTNLAGKALYFSRSPIPYPRTASSSSATITCFLHVGIYAFKRDALLRIGQLTPSQLEEIERLEQLRWLEHGMDIWTVLTSYMSMGVDNPRDLKRVESFLRQKME